MLLVGQGPVVRIRDTLANSVTAGMAGYSATTVQHFDDTGGQPHLHVLTHQGRRHAVIVVVDLEMVVHPDPHASPLCIPVGLCGERLESPTAPFGQPPTPGT